MDVPDSMFEAAGWIALKFAHLSPHLPVYTHLIISALFPIYTAAHASLSRPSSAAKPPKAKKLEDDKSQDDSDNEAETESRMESLSASDAVVFPVLAGVTLATLYFLIKWMKDPDLLNLILNWYFAIFSILSISKLVTDALDNLHSLMFPRVFTDAGKVFKITPKYRLSINAADSRDVRKSPLPGAFSRIPLPRFLRSLLWHICVLPYRKLAIVSELRHVYSLNVRLGIHGIEGLVVGIASVFYFNLIDKTWYISNLMGFGFAYSSLQLMSPSTFTTAFMLLMGLFAYDIYFVFFTPMMITVAKSIDAPVKLMFPRPSAEDEDPTRQAFSMLGLGDIVLPGMLVGLALRFDLFLFYLKKAQSSYHSTAAGSDNTQIVATSSKDVDVQTESDTTPRPHTSSKPKPSNSSKPTYISPKSSFGEALWTSRHIHTFFSPLTRPPTYASRSYFPKPYFTAALWGYIAGMVATLVAMTLSDHPQPALLYLVPGVCGALIITALIRGEWALMMSFSDDVGEVERKEKEEIEARKKRPGSYSTAASSKSSSQGEKIANGDEKGDTKDESTDESKDEKSSHGWSLAEWFSMSMFSAQRTDQRARRIVDATSEAFGGASSAQNASNANSLERKNKKSSDSKSESEGETDRKPETKSGEEGQSQGAESRTRRLFALAIDLPPPLPWSDDDDSSEVESRVQDDESDREKYWLRSSPRVGGKEEHVDKRVRVA